MGSVIEFGKIDDDDEYLVSLRGYSPERLVELFNREVGNTGWVTARGRFLIALRMCFVETGMDCSFFISTYEDEDGEIHHQMSLNQRIQIEGDKFVPLREEEE